MNAKSSRKHPQHTVALEDFDSLPNSSFVGLSTMEGLFQTSSTTIWRWSRDGKLPRPRKLGGNTTRWNVGELRQAIAKMAD